MIKVHILCTFFFSQSRYIPKQYTSWATKREVILYTINIKIMSSTSTREKKRKIGVDEASADMKFEYTGNGQIVPKDVTNVRFHPSVTEIDEKAFQNCNNKLEAVVLNDDLTEIGESAFSDCIVLQCVVIPSTVIKVS